MISKKNLFLTCMAAVALLAGCSNEPPDPSMTRSDLVVRTFNSLSEQQYSAALEQCKKLRTLGLSATAYQELEDAIRYNLTIQEAQTAINVGDFAEAKAILLRSQNAKIHKQQMQSQVDELDKLIAIEQNLTSLRNRSLTWGEREKAAIQLDSILRSYPPGEVLRPELKRFEAELAQANRKP